MFHHFIEAGNGYDPFYIENTTLYFDLSGQSPIRIKFQNEHCSCTITKTQLLFQKEKKLTYFWRPTRIFFNQAK